MDKIICFHKPEEVNGYLSNWYPSSFSMENRAFSSMEQYMMLSKALIFKDSEIADKIMQTKDVAEIKALGKLVSNYNDTVWNGVRQIIVYRGLYAKFSQNAKLYEKLMQTGTAILAECAVSDRVWGIGLSMHDEKRFDIHSWRGQNLLGFALMEVRRQM